MKVCEKALEGQYLMFSHWYGDLGWPPDFSKDPKNGLHWSAGEHWLDSPDSLGGGADIKLVWEASRFSLAYYLGRAYARDGDERWANAFWEMFDAWVDQNPPQMSVNWQCGQEMTFRLMAILFASTVTMPSAAATPERLYTAARLAWQTGRHIESNINYARSQKNNHAISEATALLTIGLLFSELMPAERWRRSGTRILAAEVKRQIYPDGSYVQHSMNYHRVMLDDLLWAVRLSELSDHPLPEAIGNRLQLASDWLLEMTDFRSGRVPNYGANDGANVLPLSCSDYLDYRPTVQAAIYHNLGELPFEPGPWDEKRLWLFGQAEQDGPVAREPGSSFRADSGGYYILRGEDSWCMTRCHTYRDRPSQCDMLHVDLWYRGINLLRDGGSYMYNCSEPWQSFFYSTAAHNTVQVDGAEQMAKGPRFLWFHWPEAEVDRFTETDDGIQFAGRHLGYMRLPGKVVHQRSIELQQDRWVVSDELSGTGKHGVTLRWRLAPAEWHRVPNGWAASVADTKLRVGLQLNGTEIGQISQTEESLYYAERTTVPMLIAEANCELPVLFRTEIAIGPPSEPRASAG
ncbi:MAG: alginate lyase family protein [Phycisphaerae bacterium]